MITVMKVMILQMLVEELHTTASWLVVLEVEVFVTWTVNLRRPRLPHPVPVLLQVRCQVQPPL